MKLINFTTAILALVSSSVPSLAGDVGIAYGGKVREQELRLVPWAISARFLDRAPIGRAVITIRDESTLWLSRSRA